MVSYLNPSQGVGAVAALAATLFEPSVAFLYNSVHLMHDLPLIELNSTSILLILKRIRSQAQDF